MLKNLQLIAIVLLAVLLFPVQSFSQTTTGDYDFRINIGAQTPSAQPNGAPAQAGISPFREVFTADRDGKEKCSASITGANTPTAVLAATPNIAHIVSQVRCYNTSTTPAAVTILDGTTTVTSDWVKAGDRTVMPLPKPYRQLVNSALNASMSAGSATTCCGNYTDSVLTTPTPTATATRTATPTP